MNIQSSKEVLAMLNKVFSSVRISKCVVPPMLVNTNNFLARYKVSPKETGKLIPKIQTLILTIPLEKRPNIKTTKNGFGWLVPYSIFLCKK